MQINFYVKDFSRSTPSEKKEEYILKTLVQSVKLRLTIKWLLLCNNNFITGPSGCLNFT